MMARSYHKWNLNRLLWVVLDTSSEPWHFTLSVPIRFYFLGSDGIPMSRESWDPAEKKWCQEFEKIVEKRFSYQYRIEALTKEGGRYKSESSSGGSWCKPTTTPRRKPLPTVKIKIDIVDITNTDSSNKKNTGIKLYIHPNQPGRDITTHDGKRVAVTRSSLSYTYKDNLGFKQTRKQRPAIHEMGHVIGLQHPNCPGNELRCYGGSSNIMGGGMEVWVKDYMPFVRYLNRLKPEYKWRVRPRK